MSRFLVVFFVILQIVLVSTETADASKHSTKPPDTSKRNTEPSHISTRSTEPQEASKDVSNRNADPPDLSKRVLHAINCGGSRHVGAYGIVYEEDDSTFGVASDFGTRYFFPNAPSQDRTLYETERYDFGDLVYRFTIEYDGSYVVILKFSEVYFESPGLKVFDVHLNNILVKDKLDIFFETNAAGLAFDMYVDFSIKDKQLKIGDVTGYIDRELQIRLTPVVDNPKINALAVLSGTSETLPPPPGLPPPQSRRRPPHPSDVDYDDLIYDTDYDHQVYSDRSSEHEFASGPPTPNPFEGTTDNIFLYLGVALVCLLPVVAILVRM